MKLVEDRGQVIDNLRTLERHRSSAKEKDREAYRSLIARGKCFVAYRFRGRWLFGPSRFIGYVDNTLRRHALDYWIDGRETNRAIERVFRAKFVTNRAGEREFLEFCRRHSISPARQVRRYISATDSMWITEDDGIEADVREIRRSARTPTEKRQLIDARRGQGRYRRELLRHWKACPVTRCRNPFLLRASHIKPWSESSDEERLNPFNGILLAAHVDRAFDEGLVTFAERGQIRFSRRLDRRDIEALKLERTTRITLPSQTAAFMKYHREKIFLDR